MEDKILATEAWKAWEEENKYHPSGINPHAFVMGYEIAKAKAALSKGNWTDSQMKEFYKQGYSDCRMGLDCQPTANLQSLKAKTDSGEQEELHKAGLDY